MIVLDRKIRRRFILRHDIKGEEGSLSAGLDASSPVALATKSQTKAAQREGASSRACAAAR